MINVKVELQGADAIVRRFGAVATLLPEATYRTMGRLVLALARRSAERKLSGQVLKAPTGTLRRSILQSPKVIPDGAGAIGIVGTNIKYAAIHEFGGRTRAHEIKASKAQALKFQLRNGAVAFRKSVMHPGSKMPERSFLRSALAEMQGGMRDAFDKAVSDTLKRAGASN